MYEKAKNNIEAEFDIVRVMKTIRRVDLMFKIVFSKYQGFFMPVLRSNILTPENLDLKDSQYNIKDLKAVRSMDDDEVKLFISQLLIQSDSSKLDKRILKNLTELEPK